MKSNPFCGKRRRDVHVVLGLVYPVSIHTAFSRRNNWPSMSHRRHPIMAQVRGKIAASLVMIHQSKSMYDMVETERRSLAHVQRRLSTIRKTFGYGWFKGRDGETHLGVDEEEFLVRYRIQHIRYVLLLPYLTIVTWSACFLFIGCSSLRNSLLHFVVVDLQMVAQIRLGNLRCDSTSAAPPFLD